MIHSRLPALLLAMMMLTACANGDDGRLIKDIEAGNIQTLEKLPETIKQISPSLKDAQSAQLAEALGFALIKNPSVTLQATDAMDKSEDTLVQRFGTGAVCALPLIMDYTRRSTLRYYQLATNALIKTGMAAQACLDIMQASMDEIKAEDAEGKIKWGNKRLSER